jgi:hypothetical protein
MIFWKLQSSTRENFTAGCLGLLLLIAGFTHARTESMPEAARWESLEPGLDLGIFSMQSESSDPDPTINILRIDTSRFELALFNASAHDNVPLTPRQWAHYRGLVSVINASMFQQDYLTSVSLMRTADHTNNSYESKDKTILAFDPLDPGVPEIKIIDRECDEFLQWRKKYKTLIQSIRMISCDRRNVWRAQDKKSSTSAVGMDATGRVLFIQTGDALSTHDLIEILLHLPIDISQAMYVEGGPQAQLYIDSGGRTYEFTGSMNALFGSAGSLAWPIPNVIGIRRKQQ